MTKVFITEFLSKVYEKALDKQLQTGDLAWKRITEMLNRSYSDRFFDTLGEDDFNLLKEKMPEIAPLIAEVLQIEKDNQRDTVKDWKQRRKYALLEGKRSTLSRDNILEFIRDLYIPFAGCGEEISFDPDELAATVPLETMKKDFAKYGVIPLRSIDPGAEVLVIGCGNLRLTGCAGEDIEDLFYAKEHEHEGQATISPDLDNNPNLLAFAGSQYLAPYFKKKKFSKIIFEGFFPFPRMKKEFCRDLLEISNGKILLNEGGQVVDMTEKFHQSKEDGVFFEFLIS